MKTKSKLHPWKEIRQTRGVRFTDSEWDAIVRAARAAKTTPSGWLRYLAAKALGTLTLLVVLIASCGGRTDLLEDDVGGKQPLWIPLAGGLQTDIDDRLVPLGRALDITNMQIDQQGKLVKRFGHTQASITGLVDSWQLARYQGARVNLGGISNGIHAVSSYSPTANAWNAPISDTHVPMTVKLTKLATKGGSNPRIAAGAGYLFVAYKDSFDATIMHLDVIDAATKMLVTANTFTLLTVFAGGYDVVFCNGLAVLVNIDGAGVVFRTLTPSTMAVTTTTFVATFAHVGLEFDVLAKDATTISVAYTDSGTLNAAAVDFVPSTLVTTGWAPRDATAAAIRSDLALSWSVDLGTSGKIALITASTTQGVRVQWDIPTAGATRQAVTTYNADPAVVANIAQLAGHTIGSGATGDFQVLISTSATLLTNNLTKMAIRTGGVLTAGFVLYRSVSLLSKGFKFASAFYALFTFSSTTDANSYVMTLPNVTNQPRPVPQAIFGAGSTGNLDRGAFLNVGLTQVVSNASIFTSAIGFINRVGTAGGPGADGIELATTTFINAFDPSSSGTPIEAMGLLFVPGGVVNLFDGVSYAEMGFAYGAPQAAPITPGAVGAMTPSSTYWYSFVFSWADAQGRLWRSAPSIPQSVALSAVQNSATIAIPTLRVSAKTNAFVEIYRGAANDDAEFQKLTEFPNDITVDSINYVDTSSDVNLASGEPLYTNGTTAQDSPLPNTTIPGSPFVFTFQGRLCFISADDPTELWFSNISTPKNGVRFNTQNVVRFADERGGLYGAAAVDDKVVAFKASGLYAFSGEGPDDAGNGSFSTPQLIALGVGSTQPRSIVPDKDGIYFMSTARQPGIQKVTRGLSLAQDKQGQGFGAAVQRYSSETIMSSVLVPEQSQVRFYCQSGRVLVYDLVAQLWTTFQLNLAGDQLLSAIAINGAALVASNGFGLFQEDVSGATYFDGSSTQGVYTVTVTTPWLEFSAIKGFGRLSELIGTGKTVGDHTLTANMYTEFDDNTIVNTKSWNETVALTPRWNWEWVPRVQRMSAAKITLTETSTTAGFQAEGMTAWIGVKPGLARQPTTTRGP